ncbi:M56 family metallopeptidase [Paenibacillus castaneae]|uniref:M56 family metallopeptidase n=1 Tax=Paenibacillus castaneae TaxID=474957 RepID=UPI002444CEFE|nr:M56 family metallopeptidase [Paenibacillus castaneae]
MKLILSLSISGSMLAGFLFLIKPLMKHRFSKSIQYYIWIVVLLRLMIPFSIEGSLMDSIFYGNQTIGSLAASGENMGKSSQEEGSINSFQLLNTANNVASGFFNNDVDHNKYLQYLFNEYVIYIWLIGVVISLAVSLSGYMRYSTYIRTTSKPADEWESRMLRFLMNGRHRVKLLRNSYVTTPMLIGIVKPIIIIPDTDFSDIQLKNILLHELTHLKRYDIGIKWLGVIAGSLHWFNPLMYFIKKEINNACELACDEAVIKRLNTSEKQQYGNTLISVAGGNKKSIGAVRATFSDEKAILKERLVAIMKHNKKPKMVIILSIILFGIVAVSAVALGASKGISSNSAGESSSIIPNEPPQMEINNETGSSPIGNYQIRKLVWNDVQEEGPSFYYIAWHSEPTLLTGLHRPKPGEKFTFQFADALPDKVTLKMAYLTESYDESLLPVISIPLLKTSSGYEFTNPAASLSDIPTTGRVYSITAEWGDNRCEYIFAVDGKFDSYESENTE